MEPDITSDFELDDSKPAVGKINLDKDRIGQKNEKDGTFGYSKVEKEIIDKLDVEVDKIFKELVTAQSNSKEMEDITSALNKMGDKEVEYSSNNSSRMMERPLRAMRNDGGEGDEVANQLKKLRTKIVELDPSQRASLFSKNKVFGIPIPFIGKKIDSYFQEYKSANSQLQDIIKALHNGKDELLHDNAEIDVERKSMQATMGRLEQYAYIMRELDKRIEEKLPEIEAEDKVKAYDIKQEILFPVRQKQVDIMQHLAACMQGYMALGLVKSNNKELIRGVDRARTTTVMVLRNAVMIAQSLGTQKLVLEQVNQVNEVTNRMIEANGQNMLKQTELIHKQATNSSIDIEVLKKSFQDTFQAMDAIDTFRAAALPKMPKTIDELRKTVEGANGYMQARQKNAVNFTQELANEKNEKREPEGGAVRIRP